MHFPVKTINEEPIATIKVMLGFAIWLDLYEGFSWKTKEYKKLLLYLTPVSSHTQQTIGMDTILVFTSANDAQYLLHILFKRTIGTLNTRTYG